MSYKNDPIFTDRQVEMDDLEIVAYVRTISIIRSILQKEDVREAPVDEEGIPQYKPGEHPDADLVVPGAYIPLRGYAHLVQELHSQGYRLVKGAGHKPYFRPLD